LAGKEGGWYAGIRRGENREEGGGPSRERREEDGDLLELW
jgi:hypothetical protein